ncbi:ribosomal protein S18-alanine N-acetyltransferase [Aestuariicoccus sp. MJ-SS9]|uniref:ribosomal protein S18-alanine N-acetyltransferase n=1 Tax=Aestuariicoccus sp. MJ-SS9 TaxID=3079855 RepID=UPI00290961E3|nr:ribosomal protein S18-alanine N-acetyltransferase [Aestuariicoccus sp. MJ-SS9]MDU8909723.1 ribosomal protein S18-alanine N-acetyltransferase [Aestuariicoccus sp. MJ-SS9]
MTPEALAGIAARAYRHMTPWSAADFAEPLAQPAALLVAEDRGFVLGRVVLDEAEVLALAVEPAMQRQGHARRLLSRFETAAAARGAGQVFLEVAAGNAAARGLYAALGYAEVGKRRDYYRQPDGARDDAICLRKDLTQGHGLAAPGESPKSG